MQHTIHLAIQIVPISKTHPYPIIDKALDVLKESGADFRVGAMETVIQGKYDEVMQLVRRMQEVCLQSGADEIVVTMKVHASANGDITWDQKLAKYE